MENFSVKKTKRNFVDFSKRFSDEVDKVFLEGLGEFIENPDAKPDDTFVYDLCSESLDKFYRLDSILHKPENELDSK